MSESLTDVLPGSNFSTRAELNRLGVHRDTMKGIAGSQKHGAESIMLNGGYEDDADLGDVVIYTGQGGRNAKTGRQVADQKLERGNLALARSFYRGQPIRLVRGPKQPGPHAPKSGYRYDGLYRVQYMWEQRGRSGFSVWRFLLVKLEESLASTPSDANLAPWHPKRRSAPERPMP
jgi:putative restriction endonuclease